MTVCSVKEIPYATLMRGSVQLVPHVGLHTLLSQLPPAHVLLVGLLPQGGLRVLRVGPRRLSSSSSQQKPKPRPKNMRSFTAFPSLLLVYGKGPPPQIGSVPPSSGPADSLPRFIPARLGMVFG